ncbi:MAG: carbohydrate ABC transporter permease [Candidatus Rokuibacteriota bacterium]
MAPGTVPAVSALRVPARGRSGYLRGEERFGWLLAGPSVLLLVTMTTVPLAALMIMSTWRLDLATPFRNRFVGIDNYARMLADTRFLEAVRITAVYAVTSVALQVGIGLGLALAFFRLVRGLGALRVAVLLPMILAPIVVGLSWKTLMLSQLYGLVDYAAVLLGLGSKPWLTDARWALGSVIVIHTWQWTPFAFLVFLASLYALPPEPFEAAMIDRAGAWQIFRYLTLPMLRPAIFVVVILRTMIALRAFEGIYATTGGGPGTATEILNLYAYRVSFNSLSLGYGAALGTVLLVATAAISAVFFWLRRAPE